MGAAFSLLPSQKPRTGRPGTDHWTIVNGILWTIRQVIPPGDAFDWVKLRDLLMLVNFGAQEQTFEEYQVCWRAPGPAARSSSPRPRSGA